MRPRIDSESPVDQSTNKKARASHLLEEDAGGVPSALAGGNPAEEAA